MSDFIKIRGARVHNLKNIDLDIPKNKLVVFTGISGSGKSSLAFDTIYAEGQRRYVESLSAYARQFIGIMQKPDVDKIEGLSPAISIDQKTTGHNPRSTVGTITEIYDYLRLLFARIGHPHCPLCSREISTMTVQQIVDAILEKPKAKGQRPKTQIKNQKFERVIILAPLVKDRKGEYSKLFEDLKRRGFSRVRVDGEVRPLDEDFVLIKTNRHTIEAVVDRIVIEAKFQTPSSKFQELRRRLTDSVETALKLSNGQVIVSGILDASFEFPESPKKFADSLYSELFSCPNCNLSLPELEPRSFSFNSPHGACPGCSGLGFKLEVDSARILNPKLSINEGGVLPWSSIGEEETWRRRIVEAVAERYQFSLDTPIENLPRKILDLLLHGAPEETFLVRFHGEKSPIREYRARFEGVVSNLARRYRETESDWVRSEIEKFMVERVCEECGGARLRKEALSVTIGEFNIAQLSSRAIQKISEWVFSLEASKTRNPNFEIRNKPEIRISKSETNLLPPKELLIAASILKELQNRLKFLLDVGLDYLTLDRTAKTLSGGEAQRIRLASQIGSGLCGVLYVLDEPSIGLHARDQGRLIKTLKDLRDLGNTVIVVEHDPQTIKAADWIVDFGPGAGRDGGRIVAEGTPVEIANNGNSLTGDYLAGRRKVWIDKESLKIRNPKHETRSTKSEIQIKGATEHNLKNIDVKIPLCKFVCITGVSGSGKSTLLIDVLFKALALKFYASREAPGKHAAIEGTESLDKVVVIDQSPIGRTPRSNPATYTGVFTPIRDLFAMTPEAKARGYQKGRFSFNVKGGRCENCQGDGELKIEMQFLPDVYVDCEACSGKRFNRETLEVEYKGKNIAEILEMTVEEALKFFANIPPILHKLQTITEVGLSYIRLGQPAPTLSGGEAQRVKLATELAKKATGKTLYILDEPTTGLHPFDIEKLLTVLHRLVAGGNTVVVIEHNLDVVKTADWIIDLGPEGGERGGRIVAEGTVEVICRNKQSYTGQYLKRYSQAK